MAQSIFCLSLRLHFLTRRWMRVITWRYIKNTDVVKKEVVITQHQTGSYMYSIYRECMYNDNSNIRMYVSLISIQTYNYTHHCSPFKNVIILSQTCMVSLIRMKLYVSKCCLDNSIFGDIVNSVHSFPSCSFHPDWIFLPAVCYVF